MIETMKYLRFVFVLAVAALALASFASCASQGGDSAEETVETFLGHWLNAQVDSLKGYCSEEVFEAMRCAIEPEADSAVAIAFREMLSSTKIVSCKAAREMGEDSVIVSVGLEGGGMDYRGDFLTVRKDGKWKITDIP